MAARAGWQIGGGGQSVWGRGRRTAPSAPLGAAFASPRHRYAERPRWQPIHGWGGRWRLATASASVTASPGVPVWCHARGRPTGHAAGSGIVQPVPGWIGGAGSPGRRTSSSLPCATAGSPGAAAVGPVTVRSTTFNAAAIPTGRARGGTRRTPTRARGTESLCRTRRYRRDHATRAIGRGGSGGRPGRSAGD